jgi:dihydrofolate reductase
MQASRITIHMAASLDGFIARKDGSVDWMETADEFAGGESMDPAEVATFLKTIDCYVMGSRTYETALDFERKGFGWAYGNTPVFVLTRRDLPRTRDTVQFHAGDLAAFVNGRLRAAFRAIWVVGGGAVAGECLRLGLADEVRGSTSWKRRLTRPGWSRFATRCHVSTEASGGADTRRIPTAARG